MSASSRAYKPGESKAVNPDNNYSSNGAEPADAAAERSEEPSTPFPLHCLPPDFEAMARTVSETERVPQSLAGCCALGILSASIGAGLQVQSGADRVTRGNLHILASAQSGSGKSETFRHLAKPFLQFETDRLETWNAETRPGLLAEREILESEIAKLKRSAGNADSTDERDEIRSQLKKKKAALEGVETSLRAPILHCEDVTTEKLAGLLAHSGEQIASLSADAVAIVNILLGRYTKLERTDEGLYLKAFSGDVCRIDRQSREPVLLQSPCLAALWLTQPDKLETLLAERSLRDGGLIPRMLVCNTHCEVREITEDAPGIPASVRTAYDESIRALLETYRLAGEPRTIHPTAEARQAMNVHYNAIVERRRNELKDMSSFAARWNEQAWRIAVCFHAGLNRRQAHERQLELATVQCAIELANWFAAQQLEILNTGRMERRLRRVRDIQSLLAGYGGTQTLRELKRRHGITQAEAKQLAADFPDLLIYARNNTGGRPRETLSTIRAGR